MEMQIPYFNLTGDLRHGTGIGGILHIAFGIQNFKDAFAGTQPLLNARVQPRETAHGSGDDHGIEDKGDHFPRTERAGDDFPSAVP